MTGIACGMRAALAADDWRRCTLGLIVEDINGNDVGVGYRRFTNVPPNNLPDAGALNYAFVRDQEIQFLGCNVANPHVQINILTHVAQDYFAGLALQLANGKWVTYTTASANFIQNALIGSGTPVTGWRWFNVGGLTTATADYIWHGPTVDPVGSIRAIKILG